MEDWKEYRLGDICNISRGSSPRPIQNFLSNKGMPWVKIADATASNSRFIANTSQFIIPEGIDKSKKVFVGDLIVSNSATPGLPKFMAIDACVHDGWLIIRDIKEATKDFLYYNFINIRRELSNQANGSVFMNLKTDIVKNFTIKLPNLRTQNKIVEILKSLDDKIELNRQINDNLEQQAQALFNHYFVENTELLGEYDEVSLLDIASYTNGLAMQKYRPSEDETSYLPVMKIKELGQGFTDSNSDICTCNIPEIYIINSGDIIFSWSGTLMVKIWCGETAGLNQHLFKVSSESYEKWFYYFWTKYHLRKFINIAKDKAVTMGHIKREDLAKSKVILPNQATLQNLNKIFSPIMDSIINNEIESKQQVQLRDTLLPRLMSGELKINEINCLILIYGRVERI